MILKLSKEEVQKIIISQVKTLFAGGTGDREITCLANLSSYAADAAEVTIEEKKAEQQSEQTTDVPF